jgi:hypothetical protein
MLQDVQYNDLILSPDGKHMFASLDNSIVIIDTFDYSVKTFAGSDNEGFKDGSKENATFTNCFNLSFSPDGQNIIISDGFHTCGYFRCINTISNMVKTLVIINNGSPKSISFTPCSQVIGCFKPLLEKSKLVIYNNTKLTTLKTLKSQISNSLSKYLSRHIINRLLKL